MNGLTILIPTRNRPQYLREALLSVKEAFGPEVRVILGDNGEYESTATVLKENGNFRLQIEHLRNPSGSTYVYNLQRLVSAARTEWISILHDDDFFVGHAGKVIGPLLKQQNIDFIFSDHWLASADGRLDEAQSLKNSRHYGRAKLRAGLQPDLALCAVRQNICLDGFIVRTRVAQEVDFNLELRFFGDGLWLTTVCDRAGTGWYVAERLFAYRLSPVSITSQGLDRVELLAALRLLHLHSPRARLRLWLQIRKYEYYAIRTRVRRLLASALPGAQWQRRRK